MESRQTPATEPFALPVFPLTRAVLFPGVLIPLHIFEPAHCAMVEQSLSTNSLLALVMVQPGEEEAFFPSLCEVGCLARIVQTERLAAGRFNILVHGLVRVRLLEECATRAPFRSYRVREVPPFLPEACAKALPSFQKMGSCIVNLGLLAQSEDKELVEVLRSRSDPLELGDVLSAILVRDCEQQQRVLATDCLSSRISVVIDGMVEAMARLSSTPKRTRLESN